MVILIYDVLTTLGFAVLAVVALVLEQRIIPAGFRQSHNDVAGFIYAVVGVVYAVVLALVVIGAWDNLKAAKDNTYKEANNLQEIYWYAHFLPKPDHDRLQTLVRDYTDVVIDEEWPKMEQRGSSDQTWIANDRAWTLIAQIRDEFVALQPQTPAEQIRYDQVLQRVHDLSDARRERLNTASEGIPRMLWVGLIIGGVITVGFAFLFGLSTTWSHATMIFLLTALISFMLIMIYEMDYPFSGSVRIGTEPFELAKVRFPHIG